MRIAALDIGGTSIKAGEIEDGTLISSKEYPTQAKSGGEAVMRRAEEILAGFHGYDRIGISTAGQVDSRKGVIRFANENIPQYTGMKVKERMEARFGVPVAVENDVNSAALGEAHYGAGQGERNFLCLTYGTGVGGAIIVDGRLYSGDSFSAGEFGHIITHAGGLPCNCGGHGCYECYASVTALVRRAAALDPLVSSGRKIFEHLDDPKIAALVEDWTQEIAYGLTSLTHSFNPGMIVLGGGIMNEISLVERLRQMLNEQLMPSYRHVRLRAAQLGNSAGMLGAAWLAENLE